jgi:hypothetical protein
METLVKQWLSAYMLKGQLRAAMKASVISKFLANKSHLAHGRAIGVEELKQKGVQIKKADEYTPDLSVIIQDIHLSVMQTFMTTGAFKIFENHLGRGNYKVVAQLIQMPTGPFPAQHQ